MWDTSSKLSEKINFLMAKNIFEIVYRTCRKILFLAAGEENSSFKISPWFLCKEWPKKVYIFLLSICSGSKMKYDVSGLFIPGVSPLISLVQYIIWKTPLGSPLEHQMVWESTNTSYRRELNSLSTGILVYYLLMCRFWEIPIQTYGIN